MRGGLVRGRISLLTALSCGLVLAACGGGAPASNDGAPADAKDAPSGPDAPVVGDVAGDAPAYLDGFVEGLVTFSCTGAGGGACNDNPLASSIWGTCGADGACHCMTGFELNPASGKCRPAPADGGGADANADAQDGAPAQLPAWKSGTRLRARLLKVADGAEAIVQGVFDKELGSGCGFVKADDGAMRCMPTAVVPYYADAECKMPIVPMATGCAPETHVSRIADCQSSGFRVGAKVTPAKTFAFNLGGACIEIPLSGTQDFYALTPVAATAFVAAVTHGEARGGDLEMRYWKSDDGGYFPVGAWDARNKWSCVAGTDAYVDRCVPAVIAPVSRGVPAFSDAMCKNPVGYRVAGCGAEPVSAVGMFAPPNACGAQEMYYAVATKLATAPYRSQGASCFPWATPAGYEFYTPGATIPADLPDLPTVLEGAGRLKVRRYETGEGNRIDSRPAFYDAIRQAPCLLQQTTKGLRCMSERAFGVSYYADDKCTMPVHVESKTKPDPQCAAPRVQILYVDKGASCGGLPTLELYEVGAATTAAKLYRADSTMGCVDSGTDPTVNDVFATTPATDTTSAALQLVTE
jgi:hypothetical protein